MTLHDAKCNEFNELPEGPLIYSCIPARTAQGGGGSFKDRKPIGEVACCDASMAEQIH